MAASQAPDVEEEGANYQAHSPLYVYIVTFLVHFGMALTVIFWRVMFNIPLVRGPFVRYLRQHGEKAITEEDFVSRMVTYKSWLGMSRSATVDALKTVKLHGPMVDSKLITLSNLPCRLSDFMKAGRPLVINMGSDKKMMKKILQIDWNGGCMRKNKFSSMRDLREQFQRVTQMWVKV
ncbi:hypothetical protein CAPTEDRAFT_205947 [Capitella teleta]|uniref:Uncharacterized protein n=1 Tax=Capitella teleta TaxID=283909 RepID=R7TZC6_CAPTE|nr:hypothetical protein CAPTEDRAFT_205947 [Capitella teleta]|eukprot:ELT98982.1 hypothetical protein CAPTEDRAFT_205947 [Capitella teleta]